MICVKSNKLVLTTYDDDDFDVESVGINGLRPAVHGAVQTKGGKKLAEIFGLHLKASADQSSIRMEQMRKLSETISGRSTPLPTIITGDLNSTSSDLGKFDKILDGTGLDMWRPQNLGPSFNDQGHQKHYDHFYVSEDVATYTTTEVFQTCVKPSGAPYSLPYYNYWISDHCPVSIHVDL
jgi:endonuclease/exonuclease/phosphatase family metal-dependent hydrolase